MESRGVAAVIPDGGEPKFKLRTACVRQYPGQVQQELMQVTEREGPLNTNLGILFDQGPSPGMGEVLQPSSTPTRSIHWPGHGVPANVS